MLAKINIYIYMYIRSLSCSWGVLKGKQNPTSVRDFLDEIPEHSQKNNGVAGFVLPKKVVAPRKLTYPRKHEWLEDDSFPFEHGPFLGVNKFVDCPGPNFWAGFLENPKLLAAAKAWYTFALPKISEK